MKRTNLIRWTFLMAFALFLLYPHCGCVRRPVILPNYQAVVDDALADKGNPVYLERLLEALKEDEYFLRLDALRALGFQKDRRAAEALVIATRDEKSEIRSIAYKALANFDAPDLIGSFIRALGERDTSVVKTAIVWLAKSGAPQAIDALLEMNTSNSELDTQREEALVKLKPHFTENHIYKMLTSSRRGNYPIIEIARSVLTVNPDRISTKSLLTLLEHKQKYIRDISVDVLGKSCRREAIAPLLKLIEQEDKEKSSSALDVLGRLGFMLSPEEIDAILDKALNDDNDSELAKRYRSLAKKLCSYFALILTKEQVTRVFLSKELNIPNAEIQLGWLGGKKQALAVLIRQTRDKDNLVVRTAVKQLGNIRSAESTDALLNILDNCPDYIKRSVVYSLGKIGDAKAAAPLGRLVGSKETSEATKKYAIDALREIGGSGSADELFEIMKKESGIIRKMALIALGKLGDERALEPLLEALKTEMTTSVIRLLGNLHNTKAVVPVLGALYSDNPNLRAAAVEALGKLVDESITGISVPMHKAASDISIIVREKAVRALASLHTHAAAYYAVQALPSLHSGFEDIIIHLKKIKGFAVVTDLISQMLRTKNSKTRRAFFKALEYMNDPRCISCLDRIAPSSATNAKYCMNALLGRLGREYAFGQIVKGISRSNDLCIREFCVLGLEGIGGEKSVKALIKALKDKNDLVRAHAALVLGRLGYKSAVMPLIELIKDKSLMVRRSALRALVYLNDGRTAEAVLNLLDDEDSSVSSLAVIILAKLHDDRVLNVVMHSLDVPRKGKIRYKFNAENLLGYFDNPKAHDRLLRLCLVSKPLSMPYSRNAAFTALAEMANGDDIHIFRNGLSMPQEAIRIACATGLGNIGDKESLPILTELLEDEDKFVRIAAACSIVRLGNVVGMKTLRQSTRDLDPKVRGTALRSIGLIKDKREVELLFSALTDEWSFVRREAINALQSWTGENFGLDIRAWREFWTRGKDSPSKQ